MRRAAHESDALVARAVPYGDAHLVLTLLTRAFGRRSVMARNARSSTKRFAGGLPTCARLQVHITLPDETLGQLERSEVLERWDGVAVDPVRAARAAVILELASHTFPEDPSGAPLFDALTGFFAFFAREHRPERLDAGWARAQLRLLDDAGWLPDLAHSSRSGAPLTYAAQPVWVPESGLIDTSERLPSEQGVALAPDALRWLQTTAAGRFRDDTAPWARRAGLRALEQVWTHLLDARPRAFDVLATLEDLG